MTKPKDTPLRFDDRTARRSWAEAQPRGRWERHAGLVVAMAPERVRHTKIKYNVWAVPRQALAEAGSDCEAIGDGVTVEVGDRTDYGPDVLVNCGERADETGVTAPNPVVVVEVLSPATAQKDLTLKLEDYFRLPSVRHCLVVSSEAARVVQHSRWADDQVLTRLPGQGRTMLDPPGVAVSVADFYAGTDLALPAS